MDHFIDFSISVAASVDDSRPCCLQSVLMNSVNLKKFMDVQFSLNVLIGMVVSFLMGSSK